MHMAKAVMILALFVCRPSIVCEVRAARAQDEFIEAVWLRPRGAQTLETHHAKLGSLERLESWGVLRGRSGFGMCADVVLCCCYGK